MKTSLTIFFLCLSYLGLSQNLSVDAGNPISSIELVFSESNENLQVRLLLNAIDNKKETDTPILESTITTDGQLFSQGENGESIKTAIKSSPFYELSPEKPFLLVCDLKKSNNSFISEDEEWQMIELKVRYTINNQVGSTPVLKFSKPSTNESLPVPKLGIALRGKLKSPNHAIVSITAEPIGTMFEIQRVVLTSTQSGTSLQEVFDADRIGDSRYANNGKIDLALTTEIDLSPSVNYQLEVTAVKIGDPNCILESEPSAIIFDNHCDLRVTNRESDHSIEIGTNDTFTDENIMTTCHGNLGIKFLNSHYQSEIEVAKIDHGNGLYSLQLSGLNDLKDGSFSTYYYTNGSNIIGPPLTIVKKKPIVTDFSFSGVSDSGYLLNFKVPGIGEDNSGPLMISLENEKGQKLEVGGDIVIQPGATTNAFVATIPNGIRDLVSKDTIVNIRFHVKFQGMILYSVGISAFNQELLNNKIAELIAETAQRRNRRDEIKIGNILKELVAIGEAVGNSIEDEEVNEAINSLANGNADNVRNVMKEIGRWALVAGKIILPIV